MQVQAILTRTGQGDYVSGKIEKPRETANEEKKKWGKDYLKAKPDFSLIISPNELKIEIV